MEINREHFGTYGWAALAAGVAAFDILSPETLSHAVDRALERPVGRYFALGAIAVTAAHLVNVLPEKADPYHYIWRGYTQILKVSNLNKE